MTTPNLTLVSEPMTATATPAYKPTVDPWDHDPFATFSAYLDRVLGDSPEGSQADDLLAEIACIVADVIDD